MQERALSSARPGLHRFGRALRRARIAIYVALAALAGYASWRFDLVTLPVEGCSPLGDVAPGDRLVVDLRADPALGRAVLFRGPEGELLLGRVAEPPPSAPAQTWEAIERGGLWIVGEVLACPGADSRLLGAIDPGHVAGTVLFSLPY